MDLTFRIPVKFGIIGTAVHIGIFLIYYFSGVNPLLERHIIDIFILPVFLYFGIREFRDVHNGNLLEFRQGMSTGLILYLVLAILTAAFTFFFIVLIDSELVSSYIQNSIERLTENKDALIEEMGLNSYNNSLNQAKAIESQSIVIDHFIKRVAIGFLLTSVISIIMKKKKEQ